MVSELPVRYDGSPAEEDVVDCLKTHIQLNEILLGSHYRERLLSSIFVHISPSAREFKLDNGTILKWCFQDALCRHRHGLL